MNMRNLHRGVAKVCKEIATSPNPDLKTVLNGYSMREMVEILSACLRGAPLTARREFVSARAGKQLLFGFMGQTTPMACQPS